jgi:hypothetical protein
VDVVVYTPHCYPSPERKNDFNPRMKFTSSKSSGNYRCSMVCLHIAGPKIESLYGFNTDNKSFKGLQMILKKIRDLDLDIDDDDLHDRSHRPSRSPTDTLPATHTQYEYKPGPHQPALPANRPREREGRRSTPSTSNSHGNNSH